MRMSLFFCIIVMTVWGKTLVNNLKMPNDPKIQNITSNLEENEPNMFLWDSAH